jgi:hypothetical protein
MNITGRIVEAFSYNTMFVIMGFLHPAAFLVCRRLVGKAPGRAAAAKAAVPVLVTER